MASGFAWRAGCRFLRGLGLFEMVCTHSWGPEFEMWRDVKDGETTKRVVEAHRSCEWCKVYWKVADPMPRVVMARLEDVKA